MVAAFFGASTLLHIVVPTVVSVDSISRSLPISTDALQVPGYIVELDHDFPMTQLEGGQPAPEEVIQALTSVPYLYGQRNVSTTGLPAGLSDT